MERYSFIFLVDFTSLLLVKSWFIRSQWRTLEFGRLTTFLVPGDESKWVKASCW